MLAAVLATLAHGALAAPPPAAAERIVSFTVESSDTLIGLSNTVLVSPAAWREVAALNRLKDPDRIWPGQVLRIPLRLMRAQPEPAQIVSASGDVQVGNAAFSAAAAGTPIREGQRLQTGADGSAVIEFADGSRMKLPPSSLAEVLESRRFGNRRAPPAPAEAEPGSGGLFSGLLRLLQGSVEVFASKVLRAKPLEVSTPTAVVGVRGTHYRVNYAEADNRSTRSEVLEGRIRADTAAASAGIDVPAGFATRLDASALPPRSVPMLPAPDLAQVPERFERPLVRFAVPGETAALRVQVAADAAFDRIVSDQTVPAGSEVRIAALDDGAWFLRARRQDAQGLEGFDAVRPFVLKARPEPPATTAPQPRAKRSVGAVEFAWAGNVQAARYHLQVARDPSFKDLAFEQTAADATRVRAELPAAGAYLWRVASIKADGDHGPFGDAQGFELRPQPEPPRGGIVGDALQLNWSARAIDRQQAELASDPAFEHIVARAELGEAQWRLPLPVRAGRYYFRYRSVEPDGFVSSYSTTLAIDVPFDWRNVSPLVPLIPFLFLL